MLVRPVADIASFPAPGWTTAPLFSKVNSVTADDTTFITALAPGAQDPQVALQIGDLEIPYGASGRIKVRMRLAWNEALTEAAVVRIGLARAADLGVTDPTLLFARSVVGFSSIEFKEIELAFDYEDWSGDSSAFGVYLEMTPDAADATAVGLCSWIEVESCVPALYCDRCFLGNQTPRDIIRTARDYSPEFEERKHPDAVLLRTLSSYEASITAKVAKVNPSLLATELVVTLPLTTFSAGVLLPQMTYVLPGIEAITAAGTVRPVELVNLTMRSERQISDRVLYLRGKYLFLGGAEEEWSGYSQLKIQAVLTPREVTGLDDPLVMPDSAHDAYVGELVRMMGIRSRFSDLVEIGKGMQEEVIETIVQQRGAETFITRDTFPEE